MIDKDFLLNIYGQEYNAEAGPWNLSRANLYIEYSIRDFFETNFSIASGTKICNIGIGSGQWDRYLSYHIGNKGSLTSIDREPLCCKQLEERLINERNPYPIEIICNDVNKLHSRNAEFDIVTIIGSTRTESGTYHEILDTAVSLLKNGGALFYMTLDKNEVMNDFIQFSYISSIELENHLYEEKFGIKCRYWKAVKS